METNYSQQAAATNDRRCEKLIRENGILKRELASKCEQSENLKEINKKLEKDLQTSQALHRELAQCVRSGTFETLPRTDQERLLMIPRRKSLDSTNNNLKPIRKPSNTRRSTGMLSSAESTPKVNVARKRSLSAAPRSLIPPIYEESLDDSKTESESESSTSIRVLNDSYHSRQTQLVTDDELASKKKELPRRRLSSRRSYSLTNLPQPKPQIADKSETRPSDRVWTIYYDGENLENRGHNFIANRFELFKQCSSCRNMLKMKSYVCVDCHQTVHRGCAEDLLKPCIPRPTTMIKSISDKIWLSSICPRMKPQIPYPLVHIIIQIERKARAGVNVYDGPEPDFCVSKKIKDIYSDLCTSRHVIDIERYNVDLFILLKAFLLSLKDPVLLKTLRQEMLVVVKKLEYSKAEARECFNSSINGMQAWYRETLAYLVLHWKRMMSWGIASQESIINTVSLPLMCNNDDELAKRSDTRHLIMRTILDIFEEDYWTRFLEKTSTLQ